jgi:hypothetical protein
MFHRETELPPCDSPCDMAATHDRSLPLDDYSRRKKSGASLMMRRSIEDIS